MFNDEESFALDKMHEFSTVDGFAELTESSADMIKYVANEPSVGLFYVQQHTQNAVPNLINLKNNVEEKARKMTLHTEDSEDSITMLRSMKECGSPIADEMIKDIKKSLAIMSTKQPKRGLINSPGLTKQPKKGLINSPSLSFQTGKTTSWGPVNWGRNTAFTHEDEGEKASGYLSTVIKSAKQKASNLKWPQLDSNPLLAASASSTVVTIDDELPLSSRVSGEVREEELENDGSLGTHELLMLSENFDEFRADREAKLEEWLGESRDHDGHAGGSDSKA